MSNKGQSNLLDNKCPVCGSKLESLSGDSTAGVKCTKCDWAVATTQFPDYYYDETKYTLYLLPNENFTSEQMSVISKKCNCNYIFIKKKLSKEKIECVTGQATELKDTIIELNKHNIKYQIEPEFKYKIS